MLAMRYLLLLALLLGLLVGGCGDGAEMPEPEDAPRPAPSLQASPEAKAIRTVEGNTLTSTARPSLRIRVDEALQFQGVASNLDLVSVRKLPVAVSVDTAETYVFTQAPGGTLNRAVLFTFLDAKKRDTLPAEELTWMPSPIERGRQRSAGQEFRYVAGPLEEPFEYYVASLLESQDISWAGCHLVSAMYRDFSAQSRMYIFYVERLDGACGDWQKDFADLDPQRKERFSAFFLNLLKFVQFQP